MYEVNRVISVILHEIRSPINAILDILQMIDRKQLDDGKSKDYLCQIESICLYMLSMSNDILNSYKNCNGQLNCKNTFNLSKLVKDIISIFHCQIKSKNLEFVVCEKNTDCAYQGDELKIKQILINLLANAVKFTPDCGKIRLSAEVKQNPEKAEVTFLLKDSGIGMSPEFLQHLFEPFAQENDTKPGGTGLGLMIVNQYVKQLGGTIDVQSEKGKGSQFTITMDLEYPVGGKIPSKDCQSKRILLVDDSIINLELVSYILKENGAEIEVACNGKLAFNKFVDSPEFYYDLILMDMRMPVLGGCEATKAIRSLNRRDASSIKIIAFSSNSMDEDINEALACGIDDYLYKPVEANKLLSLINKYL
ncbi:MAG: response regulator [Acholeplasmataceae bacterium]|nr:response regulator [Acholeplasmataceae bacterium]